MILFPSYAYSESDSEVVSSTTIIPCRIVSWTKYFISKVFTEVVCLLLALEMHSAYNVIAVEDYRKEHMFKYFSHRYHFQILWKNFVILKVFSI